MLTINKKSIVLSTLPAVFCLLLLSFSTLPGGENYRIYINKKLIMEKFVSNNMASAYLTLNQGNVNDKIDIMYNHCGQTGTARHLVIKDEQNRVVKDMKFADANGSDIMMSFGAKEILSLQTGDNPPKLKLYYSSKELPSGKLLATLVKGSSVSVAKI
jgi:hypothetical protein